MQVLHGWLHREVEIVMRAPDDSKSATAIDVRGRLSLWEEHGTPPEKLLFLLAGENGQEVGSLVIDSETFEHAGWFDLGKVALEMQLGHLTMLIAPTTDDEAQRSAGTAAESSSSAQGFE